MVETTKVIDKICGRFSNDPNRMMDIVQAVHDDLGCVSADAMDMIANKTKSARVEVESVVTFYSFFTSSPRGKVVVRLCNDVVDKLKGVEAVATAFEEVLGISMGETTADGAVSLEWTPCIGMCDQAPAAMLNEQIVTNLTPDKARELALSLKERDLAASKSEVENNIMEAGDVILAPFESGTAIKKAVAMSEVEVIKEIKLARLRGRGGAGFPAGMKWEFTRSAAGSQKYVLCNADEGEPGTFKDRVILTEVPDLLFEGMTLAGYATGASEGIIYLRAEYAYLKDSLEVVLERRRSANLLGKSIGGKDGFNFDIRIQMGAGAYICGEETALISSCEGLRGDPKNRPPFPAQKGYLGYPTTVNNVETLCCVARILNRGAAWFADKGTPGTSGTKLLSVSGDCARPGVYELEFGITLRELIEKVGATDAAAVQVGGPSGSMIDAKQFDRKVCFDDLATGGSVVILGANRSVVEVAREYMEFFVDESCGYCTPCRVGNRLILKTLDNLLSGNGEPGDIEYLEDLCKITKSTSRCGLGQTSPNPVQTTIKNFRPVYEGLIKESSGALRKSFDLNAALGAAIKEQGISGGGK